MKRYNKDLKIFFYFITMIFLLLHGCNKSSNEKKNSNENEVDDYTSVPVSSPVNTVISGNIDLNNQANNPVYLYINNNVTMYDKGRFTTNITSNVDKYENNIWVNNMDRSSGFFDNNRNFPVTASIRNYVDVNMIPKTNIGSLPYNYQGGAWSLPGGGKITYAAKSFIYPFGTNDYITAYFGFLDPSAKAFSITNPRFSVDADRKRWFLKSFGIVALTTTHSFSETGDVRIEYPIPATLLASAPDSVEAWYYTENRWILKGYAKKVNNHYTKKLDQRGLWNFGIRVSGMYKTFKVRTNKGVPVTNAILRIKSGKLEVGSARTDADGNAICYLPSNENLTIEVPLAWKDYEYLPSDFIISAGPFNSNKDVDITLPSSSPYITTISGTAFNCNSAPVQNGTITISQQFGWFQYHIPVSNGLYNSSFIRPYTDELFIARLTSHDTGQFGSDTAFTMGTGRDNMINLSTCKDPTNLFMNYSIDGVNYSIIGDASHPHEPSLTGYGSQGTMISTQDNSGGIIKGIQFDTPSWKTGTFPVVTASALFVHKIFYQYDPGRSSTITFSRYDLLAGGIIEGSMDAYYKDKLNVTHHLIAKFRVLKIT
jgi:hypothetical protein